MRRFLVLFVFLGWLASCGPNIPAPVFAQQQTLTGTLVGPTGLPINGTLSLSLHGSSFKNICSTPFQVVSNVDATFKLLNGVPQMNGQTLVSQDCLMPRIPYTVDVANGAIKKYFTANWYLPQLTGNGIDVGNMQTEKLGASPIAVALPLGIVSTPSHTQTITQPAGTSLVINGSTNFNGPVTFSQAPSFTQIITSQVLVGGLTSSAYKLDVVGLINSSQGYVINGSGGVSGQCIVSNGTAGIWQTCTTPAFPTVYNQTVQLNGSSVAQRNKISFDGSMQAVDDSVNDITHVVLNETGPGNFLITSGAALSGTNCAQGDGNGGINLTASPCLTGSTTTINNYTSGRIISTTYQNTSGHPMFVAVTATAGSGGGSTTAYVGPGSASILAASAGRPPAASSDPQSAFELTFFVPNTYYYTVSSTGGTTITNWVEWTL